MLQDYAGKGSVKVKEQKNKKLKLLIIVLAILLAGSVAALVGTLLVNHFSEQEPATAVAADNIITPESEAAASDASSAQKSENGAQTAPTETPAVPASAEAAKEEALTLRAGQAEENIPFHAVNLFPGDSETKYYRVQVSYKGDITVRYRAAVRPGYEKLAEVLRVRIRLLNTDSVLYDGLMRDMPSALPHTLYTDVRTQSELRYEITAYLDTSVGNAYQNRDLIADFYWWVEETDNLAPPQTGGVTHVFIWLGIAVGSAAVLIVLGKRRKEEENAQ